MQHRIIWGSMRLTIVTLMAAVALLTCVLAYQGLYLELSGAFAAGTARLGGAAALAAATGLLMRYREDLVDELN